jgi:hypothetical protein
MADANSSAGRVQDSCARKTQTTYHAGKPYTYGAFTRTPPELPRRMELLALPPAVLEQIDAATSLPGRLRLYLETFTEDRPCRKSAAEYAEMFCPTSKPENGEAEIRRAFRLLRATHREQFHQRERWDGRSQLRPARWFTRPGVDTYTRTPSSSVQTQRSRSGSAPRARAEVASRSNSARRRAVRLELPPLPAVLACHEVEVALAAVRAKFGDLGAGGCVGVLEIEADLRRRPTCRERPVEVERVLRTLAQRETLTPLILFRDLFKKACGGDMLCDAPADAARTVAAELGAAGDKAREEVDGPETYDARAARLRREGRYWADLRPPPGEQPLPLNVRNVPPPLARPMNHEERALARARRLRVAALEPPPPLPRADPDSVSRFLKYAAKVGSTVASVLPTVLEGSEDTS